MTACTTCTCVNDYASNHPQVLPALSGLIIYDQIYLFKLDIKHILVLVWMMNFASSCMLSSLKCLLRMCTHYLFFNSGVFGYLHVSSNVFPRLPGICSLREISRRAAYANRRPRHHSRNGKLPFPYCSAVWNWIVGLGLIC